MRVLFLIGRFVFGGFFLTSAFFDLRHYRFFVPLLAASGVPFHRFAVIFALLLILVGFISWFGLPRCGDSLPARNCLCRADINSF